MQITSLAVMQPNDSKHCIFLAGVFSQVKHQVIQFLIKQEVCTQY